MKKVIAVLIPVVLFLSLMIVIFEHSANGGSSDEHTSGATLPREETLYVGGMEWGPQTSFNPLASDPGFGIDYNLQLIYECLFGYDQLTGEMLPILGKSIQRTDSVAEVVLDRRAYWNDGTPVTVDDIVYTFTLDSIYPTARHGNWKYLSGVTATSDSTVVFHYNPDNYNPLLVLDMLATVSILPRNVFEALERSCWNDSIDEADFMKLLQFKNDSAIIGSGPYTLYDHRDDRVILRRLDRYWGAVKFGGSLPTPRYIVHSRYNSNYHFTDAMRKGRLDCSCHFMPRIEEYAKDGIRAWDTKSPYHLPASIPTLFLATEKAPFNDVIFRLALIHAIDFDKIARLAFCNYSPPLHPGLILPFGLEACWYSEEDAKRYGYSFSIDKARWLLREEGYTWNTENRLIAPDGKPVRPLSVECPSGWTDWENAIRIAIDGFRALGIDASEQFINYGLWNQHAVKGTFDMLMRTSTAELWPSTPWRRFQQLLSSKNYRPVGQEMTDNFGRYRNATVDSLLEFIPRTTDPRTLRELYRQLNIIFMREAPVLPLGYRPAVFYQFSEKHWTGFPTAEHPSAPPQMLMIGAGIKGLWGIRPVKEAL